MTVRVPYLCTIVLLLHVYSSRLAGGHRTAASYEASSQVPVALTVLTHHYNSIDATAAKPGLNKKHAKTLIFTYLNLSQR